MTVDIEVMRRRWMRLLPVIARESSPARKVFDDLIAAYSGPDRHYHNLDHIEALLAVAESEAALFEDPAAASLAIFFHDAVYDPTSALNEHASAELARDRLARLEFDPACIGKVADFIEATAHANQPASANADLKRLLDLDLSILAAQATVYDAYAAAIRAEYAHVPDSAFRIGRAKVLQSFLARPRIYLCDDHHAAWDQPARSNLSREIAKLQTSAP